MSSKIFSIGDLFTVHTGDYHATKELSAGETPLISCGDSNNGLVGYYDIPPENQYANTITVAYNGQPLTAKFHPYSFGAKDDVAVLLPKSGLSKRTLIYIAAVLNKQRWRFSYGRKCFRSKMKEVGVPLPATENGALDKESINSILSSLGATLPKKTSTERSFSAPHMWEERVITEFFKLEHGDFHSLSGLDPGDIPTVSRLSSNNGVTGYHEPPGGARIYGPGKITVSTVNGKAFVQLQPFICTDNVVILDPKRSMDLRVLFFFQLMLDRVRWRYSYGRQCYKTKFSETAIAVPIQADGSLDQGFMRSVVTNASYWKALTNIIVDGQQEQQLNTRGRQSGAAR